MPEVLADSIYARNEGINALLQCICIMLVKKLSDSFIRYSARLTEEEERKKEEEEDERNAWAAISRTPTLNAILVKLKVAINADTHVQHV